MRLCVLSCEPTLLAHAPTRTRSHPRIPRNPRRLMRPLTPKIPWERISEHTITRITCILSHARLFFLAFLAFLPSCPGLLE